MCSDDQLTVETEDTNGCMIVTCEEKCCEENLAICQSCKAGKDIVEYCEEFPGYPGCPCKEGETTVAPDMCNTCTCTEGQEVCTEKVCDKCPNWCPNKGDNVCNFKACSGCEAACPPTPQPTSLGPVCPTWCPNKIAQGKDICSFAACVPCYDECAVECEAGQTKVSDDLCNGCECDDGKWSCTENQCGDKCQNWCPNKDNVCDFKACSECVPCAVTKECEAGETKFSDDLCNSCECSDEGKWECSEEACPANCKNWCPNKVEAGTTCNFAACSECAPCAGQKECEAGETKFTDDFCNSCECDDGKWSCTNEQCNKCQNWCPNKGDPDMCNFANGCGGCAPCVSHKECEAGETKYTDDFCNKCECDADGMWSCGDDACNKCQPWCLNKGEVDMCNFANGCGGCAPCQSAKCEEGLTVVQDDGCNICTCVNGVEECSDRPCDKCKSWCVNKGDDMCNFANGCGECAQCWS